MCGRRALVVAGLGLVLIALALGGAAISWRAWHPARLSHDVVSEHNGRATFFLAAIGALAGALFAIVVAMQAAAALILDGCLR
jgi:hypothetical protein